MFDGLTLVLLKIMSSGMLHNFSW